MLFYQEQLTILHKNKKIKARMKIIFSVVVVERRHLPKKYQNFKFFVGNAFGIKDDIDIDSLEFSYKEGEESKTIFYDDESYNKLKLLEQENKINEIYIEMKPKTVPPEELPITDKNYYKYLMRVLGEELGMLKDNLSILLPDKKIIRELPEFITVNKIQCNQCKSSLIVGPLYKCIICDNTHFCEECIDTHAHPCLKIYK